MFNGVTASIGAVKGFRAGAGGRLKPRSSVGRVTHVINMVLRLHDFAVALVIAVGCGGVAELRHRVVLHDYGATTPLETAIVRVSRMRRVGTCLGAERRGPLSAGLPRRQLLLLLHLLSILDISHHSPISAPAGRRELKACRRRWRLDNRALALHRRLRAVERLAGGRVELRLRKARIQLVQVAGHLVQIFLLRVLGWQGRWIAACAADLNVALHAVPMDSLVDRAARSLGLLHDHRCRLYCMGRCGTPAHSRRRRQIQ